MMPEERESPPMRVANLGKEQVWLFDLSGDLLDTVEGNPLFIRELERHREGESFDITLFPEGPVRVRLLRLGKRLCAFLSKGTLDFPFAHLMDSDTQDIFYRVHLFPERYFEYVSPSATHITGYTPQDHYVDPDLGFKLIHPEDRTILREIAQGRFFGKPVCLRWVRKDGEIIWTEQVNVPVYDEEGNLVALEGIARDVTERKKLEDALKEKAQEFEWLLENMINAFVIHEAVFDEKGHFVDFRILYVNQAYENVVGVKREKIIGRTARELWPGMEEEWFRYHEKVVRTGIPQTFELYHTPTRRYYRCRAYRPWKEGNRYCVVFDDVTQEKLAAERATHLNRLLLAIRNVNQLITQEEDPHRLIEGACQKLTETPGIFHTWIVLLDETQQVFDFATCEEPLSTEIAQLFSQGNVPPCVPQACQRGTLFLLKPSPVCSTCAVSKNYGDRARAILPLSFEKRVYGVLGMSLPRILVEDPEVQELLHEVAQDLGFALYKTVLRKTLQEVEIRYQLLVENIPGVVYLCRPQPPWVMLYCNDHIEELTGYSREEFLSGDITYAELCHPEDLPAMTKEIDRALRERRPFHLIYRLRHREGNWRFVEEWGGGIFIGETVQYLEGFIQDVTERELARERIEYLATHDPLTGLYNRSALEKFLEEDSLRYPRGILLYDVNGLRLLNEAFGQKKGDELLVLATSLLRDLAPETSMLFRFGGDEFLVLLPNASENLLRELSHTLRECAKNKAVQGVPLSISVGWSLWENPNESFEQALSRAEHWLHRRKLSESQSAHSTILNILVHSLRETTQETETHARRMLELAHLLGEALHLSEEELEKLELLARLHDVGKIAVPRAILDKSGPLTTEEWEVIKRHPEAGFRIAQSSPDLAPIAPLILTHHERYDGTGYPQGLRGEEIPFLSRIIAVIDAYDVMCSGRPYKPPLTKEEALAELRRCRGTQFDPQVVDMLISILTENEQ